MNIKYFFYLISFYAGLLHAGAVIRIDRVDLDNGQRIIFFSEQHAGQITPQIHARDLCPRQASIFEALFDRLILNKNNIAFYIEINPTLISYNRERLGQGFPLIGCEPSFFDTFYIKHMYGQTEWGHVDTVRNFDTRTSSDWNLLNDAASFDKMVEQYKVSGFSKERFEEMKQQFFHSPESLRPFANPNIDYIEDFKNRLKNAVASLQSKLPEVDRNRITLLGTRAQKFDTFLQLLHIAQDVNKPLFAYLFDLAEQHKENFYVELGRLLNAQIISLGQLVSFMNGLADLSLLEAIITDNHPIILVLCGAFHAEMVIQNFFMNNPRVRSISSLNMLDEKMINNLDYAQYQVGRFVLGD